MVENNVKENLIDDEEELYVNLNDLVNLRESAELKEAADAFESYLEFTRALTPEMSVELEGHKDNEVPET